ncbi:hypothetical protein MO973_06705 [Paenibacillus sp. TRM 82003]|nr:hypothetical protein [Paenibacillus sp. TRM 82003]
MSDTRAYFFSFSPMKLRLERENVEQQFRGLDAEANLRNRRDRLPQLLQRIRQTPMEHLDELIASLSNVDVKVLMFDMPFDQESTETRGKINRIFLARYSPNIGAMAWNLFQDAYENPYVRDLLQLIYVSDPDHFLHFEVTDLEMIANAVNLKKGLIIGFSEQLVISKDSSKSLLDRWRVRKQSPLEKQLVRKMLERSLQTDDVMDRDGARQITVYLDLFELMDYKSLLKIYLETRNYQQFQMPIMKHAISRLYDPRERAEEWDFLSLSTMDEVHRWLIQGDLEQMFENDGDNRRFMYWKLFIHEMYRVDRLQRPDAAIMYFRDFVVVEFGKIGAAYFYFRVGFTLYMEDIVERRRFHVRSMNVKESMLKNRELYFDGKPLFIDKLHHVGDWEYPFMRFLERCLQGDYR